MTKFKLPDYFIEQYKHIKPPFGFNGLGEAVYLRTYSRMKKNGDKEKWYETIRRVVEGTYRIQKEHIIDNGLHWDEQKAIRSAQEMYDRMFNIKFLPGGRGLWAMGTVLTEEKNVFASLNNCSFISTSNNVDDPSYPYTFAMDASMLGVGVGFDTLGDDRWILHEPDPKNEVIFVIPDSREGWVESLRLLLDSYFLENQSTVLFDYSLIRPSGEPIRGFGGVASGPEPLKRLHDNIHSIFKNRNGERIKARDIVDIMNFIGVCVVAGNVRRTALLALGSPYNEDYLDLKNYEKNPDRESFGWTSNNTVVADVGMDYNDIVKRTIKNGEPGYLWLENARAYGRMEDSPDWKDYRVSGGNPCNEQSLESGELCCLSEVFLNRAESKEDFLRTLKFCYLYTKTVTLTKTQWKKTNAIMLRNRRIGTSLTGIVQFLEKNGLEELRKWCNDGYNEICDIDKIYSEWFCIPESIKKTTIKPSGTVSLLSGSTPGLHYPESRFYIRRVRMSKKSDLLEPLQKAGYHIEDDKYDNFSVVVEFPVDAGEGVRGIKDVSVWEQVRLVEFMQRWWSDNQVSVTIKFKKSEAKDISRILEYSQYHLKSISFLPFDEKVYEQAPYESITETQYKELIAEIKPLDFENVELEDAKQERFCGSDTCVINVLGE